MTILCIYLSGVLLNIVHVSYILRNQQSRIGLLIKSRNTIELINKQGNIVSFSDVLKFGIVVGVLLSWAWLLVKLFKK